MNRRWPVISTLLSASALAFLTGGCDCLNLVSQSESINTALASRDFHETYGYVEYDRAPTRDYGYITPVRTSPRVISLGETVSAAPAVRSDWRTTGEVIGVSPYQYGSEIVTELESMERSLERIEARAGIKGAAAQAALDPKVRDFNDSVAMIEEYVAEVQQMRNAIAWRDFVASVEESMQNARESVREAARVVSKTPDNEYQEPVDRDI